MPITRIINEPFYMRPTDHNVTAIGHVAQGGIQSRTADIIPVAVDLFRYVFMVCRKALHVNTFLRIQNGFCPLFFIVKRNIGTHGFHKVDLIF
jgi:hypothetical protein